MKNKIRAIIFIVALIAITVIFVYLDNLARDRSWNNGICNECNVEYELKAYSGGQYIYVCPECLKEVIQHKNRR